MNMQFKAVLFDLGGTLIRTAEIPRIYKRILKAHGVMVSADKIYKAHRANEKNVDVVEGQIELGKDFWIKWNLKILETLGIEENTEFLARKIDEQWWEYADLKLYPEVKKTVTKLKAKGLKVGIITNGLENDFQRISKKLRLTNWFDVVVAVDSCNRGKPSKEIFLYALDKLGIRPDEALFVGDSIKLDYEGAENAGIKPLLIDREGKSPKGAKTLRSLAQVLNYL